MSNLILFVMSKKLNSLLGRINRYQLLWSHRVYVLGFYRPPSVRAGMCSCLRCGLEVHSSERHLCDGSMIRLFAAGRRALLDLRSIMD